MRNYFLITTLFAISIGSASVAAGLNAEKVQEINDLVASTAETICSEFLSEGSSTSGSATLDATGELNMLLRRLGQVSGGGSGELSFEKYKGILQEELSGEIVNNRECRLKIWNDLRPIIIAELTQGGAPEQVNSGSKNASSANRSFSTAHYAGIANPDLSERSFLETSEIGYFYSFDVSDFVSCTLSAKQSNAHMYYHLFAPSRQHMARGRTGFTEKLAPGTYYIKVEGDRPVFYEFDVYCDKLS